MIALFRLVLLGLAFMFLCNLASNLNNRGKPDANSIPRPAIPASAGRSWA